MNKVFLMGRLAKDVDLRSTQSGKSVARMTIAVDRPYSSNRQAGQPTADFLNLIAWEKKADFAGKYLHKGSKILVEGRLETRSYEAQDGSKRYVTEIKVSDIEFAESKNSSGGFSQQYEQAVDNNEPVQGSRFGKVDDEMIPF